MLRGVRLVFAGVGICYVVVRTREGHMHDALWAAFLEQPPCTGVWVALSHSPSDQLPLNRATRRATQPCDSSRHHSGACARSDLLCSPFLHLHQGFEYVAIFDADFEPPEDFLYQTIIHMMRDDNCAFVQTRWTFTNSNSLLTWAQKVGLAFHFAVEQRARSFLGNFFNFNGTAGVWRIKVGAAAMALVQAVGPCLLCFAGCWPMLALLCRLLAQACFAVLCILYKAKELLVACALAPLAVTGFLKQHV